MDEPSPKCPHPRCFFCIMKEENPSKRRSSIGKFFRELPLQDDDEDGQVLPISGLWNTAMANPDHPEFIELGIFECMKALIWKGFKNHQWLSHDQNIYIPYYAAHIIGSYTMNTEEFAERAVAAGVIPPLMELLRGRLTWVEQRVAVRALGHIATYPTTFPELANHSEILSLTIKLAVSSLEIVYLHFYQFSSSRMQYHRDLLTRGMGGTEMESQKAEEWASQLQCWSLQLINCFALKPEFLPAICKPDFLTKLPAMWGGLANENSPAGVGLLRTICHHKIGRSVVAGCPTVVEALSNMARSSDDWQYMAVDCLLWLVQDPITSTKVADQAIPALVDLAEVANLGDHKKLGDSIVAVLRCCADSTTPHSKQHVEELLRSRNRSRWEKGMSKEDLRIKQAAVVMVKMEGNSLFSSGNVSAAASKFSAALSLCPMRQRKERVVLYSNRAQCHLMLQQPLEAISDATKALCLLHPPNCHAKSLWRRAQAYDMLGLAKESLLDAILFINECSRSNDLDLCSRQNNVPDYARRLVRKQMRAAWLFREAAMKHGGDVHYDSVNGDDHLQGSDRSEWETASESDVENGEQKHDHDDDDDDVDDDDDDHHHDLAWNREERGKEIY